MIRPAAQQNHMSSHLTAAQLQVGIISLFPEMFAANTYGICGRALSQGKLVLHFFNPRDFSEDHHRRVDSRPYGGGAGMVLQAPPLAAAIQAAKQLLGGATPVIYMSPQGQLVTQKTLHWLREQRQVIFLSGRYEGIDQRLLDTCVDAEWSIGNYVVSGGELPIMLLLDGVARLLPGVTNAAAIHHDSFYNDSLLDYPQYTRPLVFAEQGVPEVLLSGDHAAIARWRQAQRLQATNDKRPELLQALGSGQVDWLSNKDKGRNT
jgi:tRNA (guanine37-N1)-methyltransferase